MQNKQGNRNPKSLDFPLKLPLEKWLNLVRLPPHPSIQPFPPSGYRIITWTWFAWLDTPSPSMTFHRVVESWNGGGGSERTGQWWILSGHRRHWWYDFTIAIHRHHLEHPRTLRWPQMSWLMLSQITQAVSFFGVARKHFSILTSSFPQTRTQLPEAFLWR